MATSMLLPAAPMSGEEWPDVDFDIPEGQQSIMPESDREDDEEDWDLDMDLGRTAGIRAKAVVAGLAARTGSIRGLSSRISPSVFHSPIHDLDDLDDDEGTSTIKVSGLMLRAAKPAAPMAMEENMEDAFVLPADLTQLSLRPLALHHRSSKTSLEWGDKDQTSSSQSSDAYSTLGLHDQPSSNYTSASSMSAPEETDDDDDDGELDGLVLPTELFSSRQGGKHLAKMLEVKKRKAHPGDGSFCPPIASPEEDFEIGLVIEDADFSPSRLKSKRAIMSRSKSVPVQPGSSNQPPSRLKDGRARSANNPFTFTSSMHNPASLSPPPRSGPPPSSFNLGSLSPTLPSSSSFLTPRPANLRGQKSHTGLKPPPYSGPSRRLTRKASLPSLSDNRDLPSGSAALQIPAGRSAPRYDAPTAASLAKMHSTIANRVLAPEQVPPTRPSTPSANPAALRLTMPTSSSRLKTRPPISSVFPPASAFPYTARTASPFPPRPASASAAATAQVSARLTYAQTAAQPAPPRLLRRAKRQRLYGDGTELDDIDDLPTDAVKENLYRVPAKAVEKRIPGSSYPYKTAEKGTLWRRSKREGSDSCKPQTILSIKQASPSKSLARQRKKPTSSSPPIQTQRKPTLIRNLGGAGTPKVVGDMKWNPKTLRWEGNEHVLRDFEAAVPARPALITHLTGSSVGSPVGSFAAGARIVGNMIFDPARMCWMSTLPPEDDEPDVFADFADDEEDWEARGGTIRANQQGSATVSDAEPPARLDSPSPVSGYRARAMSESESDRGSRASMVFDVDDIFLDSCSRAEERNRLEMKGWKTSRDDLYDRTALFEIRALATRQY